MDDLANDSPIGRLLEEISWQSAKKYRNGGRGIEYVLTAEVEADGRTTSFERRVETSFKAEDIENTDRLALALSGGGESPTPRRGAAEAH